MTTSIPTPPRTDDETARQQVAHIYRTDGVDALRNLTPLALTALLEPDYDPSDPATLAARSVTLQPGPAPLLDATLRVIGATRHGHRTYSVGVGANADPRIAAAALDTLPAGACYPQAAAADLAPGTRLRDQYPNRSDMRATIRSLLHDTPAGPDVIEETSARFDDWHRTEWAHSAVLLTVSNNRLYIRLCTQPGSLLHADGVRLPGQDTGGLLDLDRLPTAPDTHRPPLHLYGTDVFTVLAAAETAGWATVLTDNDPTLTTLTETARNAQIVTSAPGTPGRATVHTGLAHHRPRRPESSQPPTAVNERTVLPIADLPAPSADLDTYWESEVEDLYALAAAEPADRDGLRPYQDLAVSRYLATNTGYLLALAPGLGKTVITLAGWSERAEDRWRGLAVVPAHIRGQWAQEAAHWFPNCTVFDVRTGNDLNDITLEDVAGPALVIVSYHLAKDHLDWLTGKTWDDLCLDEAAFLKNATSQRSEALWTLREHVADSGGRALALTGTPLDRSVDDLTAVISWARGDRELFGPQKLSQRFPRLAHGEDLDEFADVLGPTLLRRDRSEIADELPQVNTIPLLLTPTPAERALADGARYRLRELYEQLQTLLDTHADRNPDDPRYQEAKDELAGARGAILGGVTLARMAASDPHAVAASASGAAELLASDGLIDAATRTPGTKRREVGAYIADLAAAGESVLVFTDFSTVADNLAADLTAAGVAAGVMAGGRHGEQHVAAFQTGNLNVLIATSAGREGLNLQAAGVLIHYDLPWVPSQIVQRFGRASRIGADTSRPLQVVVPVMEHTIEQRVAAILIPRALTAIHALDGGRGGDRGATDMAVALRGIAGTAGTEADALGDDLSMFDLARTVIG